MNVFDAYLAYGINNHNEWLDFVDYYIESCTNDRVIRKQIELLEFKHNQEEDEFWEAVHYYLRENIGDLPLQIVQVYDKDSLWQKIISITNYGFKKTLIDILSGDLRWSLRFESEIVSPHLSDLVDQYYIEKGVPDFDTYEDYQIRNYLLDYSNRDKIVKFIELFSIENSPFFDKIILWSFEVPATGLPKKSDHFANSIIVKADFLDLTFYETIQKQPDLLKTMDWRLFEEMLADILKYFKYKIELTRKTKDGGIDIIAIKSDEQFGRHKYLLQAKRYKEAVEVSPVRELMFLHNDHRASKCCLATTSKFTKGAWELAEQYKWQIELKDQKGILEWINKIVNKK